MRFIRKIVAPEEKPITPGAVTPVHDPKPEPPNRFLV